jgi:6-phosphogluconolactonase (cycloisomerase 2 family)
MGLEPAADVIVFRIDPSKGKLAPTGSSVKVPSPVCVLFREMK